MSPPPSESQKQLEDLLRQRILVLDGAMGTMVHALQFTEKDFRGRQFADRAGECSIDVDR